jgi:hypothetical protein
LEITVTFLIPVKPDDDLEKIGSDFVQRLPGDWILYGNSYAITKPSYFLVSGLHRIGKKLQTKITYLRPGSPRR